MDWLGYFLESLGSSLVLHKEVNSSSSGEGEGSCVLLCFVRGVLDVFSLGVYACYAREGLWEVLYFVRFSA